MSDLPNRDELERRYARIMARLLRTYGQKLVEALGDPPSASNIPYTFWQEGERELINGLAPLVQDVYISSAQRLVAQSPIGVDWALINQGAVDWSRTYVFDQVSGLTSTNRRMLQSALSAYFEQGQTRQQLEAVIMRGYSPVRAEMIAVTEITRAATEGEKRIAAELAREGMVMVPVWQTNRDELVCPICGPRAGKPIADGQFPPAHPRCRCWTNYEFMRGDSDGW